MIENYTDVKAWSVEDIINSLEESPPKKERIIIPKFQRSLVWSDMQRKDLIDSIKNGMPIGALLLYRTRDNNGITEHQLVDGLQRVTTLKKYYDKPTDYYCENDLHKEFIDAIAKFLEGINISVSKDILKNYIVEWIKSTVGFEETKGFASYELVTFLDNKLEEKYKKELTKNQEKELVDILKPHLKKIKDESDISDFKVPVIIYTGDKSNLPTIFERINSKGTQLNKYQIFAATWSTYGTIEITNRDIIEKIRAKYETLIEEGLNVENYDPTTFNTSKFTYFEYLFGFGKLLVEKFPLLFKSSASEHETDSIGFNLVAICLNHNLKKLDTLPESLRRFNLDQLEQKIFDSIKIVNEVLQPYIGLRGNIKNNKKFPVIHTEFQIVSLIGKVFRSKYKINKEDGTIEDNEKWEKVGEKLKQNIPQHYLYDIIKGFWSGTGDSKAMERVDDEKYVNPISRELWESTLLEWHENEKSKKEKNRTSISKASILFLKYIYTNLISVKEEYSDDIGFEVDHVIPFACLKDIANQIGGLPISAIGNLALIWKNLNRNKSNKTFYQHYDELVADGEMTEAQKKKEIERIETYTFTTREMLAFLDDLSAENIEAYYSYLDERFKKMRDKFYELNRIS